MGIGITIFFVIIVVYTVFAGWLDRKSITMPMVFVAVGALLSQTGLNFIGDAVKPTFVADLTEITLALLLFSDASSLSFERVNEDKRLLGRLLIIALPLTILFGAMAVLLVFPAEGFVFAALLGAILAPTDAALGGAIFNNPKVPTRIRRALTVESGLNDGLATPFVTLFTLLAVAEESFILGRPVTDAIIEIAIAVGLAVVVGAGLGWLLARASERGWTSALAQRIAGIALPLVAFMGATVLGGNGFIAAFVGGLLFGRLAKGYLQKSSEAAEFMGTLLSLFVWTIFGILVVGPILIDFNPKALVFALVALTLVRMIPVAISMRGLKFRRDTLLTMGWFGPRGLASVVFVIIALESFNEAGRQVDTLITLAGWTILLSVLLHGFSAGPLANLYARRLKRAPSDLPELKEVSEYGMLRQNFKPK